MSRPGKVSDTFLAGTRIILFFFLSVLNFLAVNSSLADILQNFREDSGRTVISIKAVPPYYSGTLIPQAVNQGKGLCGEYSTSTSLSAFKKDADFNRVVREMPPLPFIGGTSPQYVIDYEKSRGLPARAMNNASLETINSELKAGRPVKALVRATDSIKGLHWVTVTGVRTGPDGKKYYQLKDSYWGAASPAGSYWMSEDEFLERWSSLDNGSFLEELAGEKRYLILYDGRDDLFSDFETSVENSLITSALNIANFLRTGNRRQLVSGLIRGVGGLGALPFSLAGRPVRIAGKQTEEYGALLEKSRGGIAINLLGTLLRAGGKGLREAGNFVDFLGKNTAFVANTVASFIAQKRDLFGFCAGTSSLSRNSASSRCLSGGAGGGLKSSCGGISFSGTVEKTVRAASRVVNAAKSVISSSIRGIRNFLRI